MFTLTTSQIQPALKKVFSAASEDEQRPVLWNVLLTGTPQGITLYAADGFRLHFATIAAGTDAAVRLIVDSAAVKAILKVKTTRKDDPEIVFNPEQNTITCNGSTLGGFYDSNVNYPDVNQIIPTHSKISITVNPLDLLAAVKIARIFARDASNVCKLTISPDGSMIVTGKSEETGESNTTVRLASVTTPSESAFVIGLNCDFLVDALKACNPNPVKIEFNQKNTPVLFSDADGFGAVIMPFFLDSYAPAEVKNESEYNTTGAYVYPDSYSCAVTESYNSTQQSAPARVAFEEYNERRESDRKESEQFPQVWDYTTTPESDATETEVKTIFSYFSPDNSRTNKGKGVIVFHLVDVPTVESSDESTVTAGAPVPQEPAEVTPATETTEESALILVENWPAPRDMEPAEVMPAPEAGTACATVTAVLAPVMVVTVAPESTPNPQESETPKPMTHRPLPNNSPFYTIQQVAAMLGWTTHNVSQRSRKCKFERVTGGVYTAESVDRYILARQLTAQARRDGYTPVHLLWPDKNGTAQWNGKTYNKE